MGNVTKVNTAEGPLINVSALPVIEEWHCNIYNPCARVMNDNAIGEATSSEAFTVFFPAIRSVWSNMW